jgi:hypothetical protein
VGKDSNIHATSTADAHSSKLMAHIMSGGVDEGWLGEEIENLDGLERKPLIGRYRRTLLGTWDG